MPRTLNSPIADQRSEFIYLYEIFHSGGGSPLRLTSANHDIVALTLTWTAAGGTLVHSVASDTSDRKGQGAEVNLYGLDQTIISQIQNNNFRGRLFRIYLLHLDPDTGVPDVPDLVFQGRQNGDYRVTESRDPESVESGGVVTVSTRISADLAAINHKVSLRCNVHSHEEMLRRSGVVSPDDKFFERLPALINKDIYWGTDAPERRGGSIGVGGGDSDRGGNHGDADVWV